MLVEFEFNLEKKSEKNEKKLTYTLGRISLVGPRGNQHWLGPAQIFHDLGGPRAPITAGGPRLWTHTALLWHSLVGPTPTGILPPPAVTDSAQQNSKIRALLVTTSVTSSDRSSPLQNRSSPYKTNATLPLIHPMGHTVIIAAPRHVCRKEEDGPWPILIVLHRRGLVGDLWGLPRCFTCTHDFPAWDW
jgi:hypothetical protein